MEEYGGWWAYTRRRGCSSIQGNTPSNDRLQRLHDRGPGPGCLWRSDSISRFKRPNLYKWSSWYALAGGYPQFQRCCSRRTNYRRSFCQPHVSHYERSLLRGILVKLVARGQSCQSGSWKGFGGKSLGVGQSWQNFTGSRSYYTTYTNATGGPIFISVRSNRGGSCDSGSQLYVNGNLIGESYASCVNHASTLYSVIPDTATYMVQPIIAGNALSSWWELR